MKTQKYVSRNKKIRRKQRQKTKKVKRTKNRGGTNENAAAKTIQKFMKNPTVAERRTSLFLKNICSDSKTCIAFGIEQQKIYDFFDGYTNKKYIKLPILPIQDVQKSKNGFVNQIEYERDGYKSYAIMKTSLKPSADNLVYEYIVGKYLNKMSKFYPCIMQTYALIQYDNVEWNRIDVDPTTPELLYAACSNPLQYGVLTQHIKDSLTLYKMVREFGIIHDTILSLHQIYFTLHCLRNNFTHYDLHLNNILCYSVGNYKYIEFNYYMNDGTVIKYNYNRLAYMIDYGRCFFHESDTNNSERILNTLCTKPCPTPCGVGHGFKFLFGNPDMFINGTQRNMSADLRAMRLAFHPYYGATPEYRNENKNIFEKIVFDGSYSTPEVLEEGFSENKINDFSINNVSDAFHLLTTAVNRASDYIQRIYRAKNYTKLGTLHIYEDGITPIRYEPYVPLPEAPISDEIANKKQKIDTTISKNTYEAPPPIPTVGILRNRLANQGLPTPIPSKIPVSLAPAYDPSIFDADTRSK